MTHYSVVCMNFAGPSKRHRKAGINLKQTQITGSFSALLDSVIAREQKRHRILRSSIESVDFSGASQPLKESIEACS